MFPQPIIQVLMIIVSCILAWGEAWFLDCRVIPKEKSAQRFYRFLMVCKQWFLFSLRLLFKSRRTSPW